MKINFTQISAELAEKIRKDKDIQNLPNGELHTSGDGFEQLQEAVESAIEMGAIDDSCKLVALVDRAVTGYTPEDKTIEALDYVGVVSSDDGSVGLLSAKGFAWYTKEQKDSLKKALALI